MNAVTHRVALLPVIVVLVLALVAAVAHGEEPKLSRKVPIADPAVYKPRMANEWPNPRVLVDTDGVYLFVDGRTHLERATPIDKLANELAHLPLQRWPWGKIVALSLSPRMPVWKEGVSSVDDPRFAPLVRVRRVLQALGLEVVETPVGCHCQ